eukprot:COSAG03_NODE_1067_length_4919_cov_1.767842_7_plen_64_part_00
MPSTTSTLCTLRTKLCVRACEEDVKGVGSSIRTYSKLRESSRDCWYVVPEALIMSTLDHEYDF